MIQYHFPMILWHFPIDFWVTSPYIFESLYQKCHILQRLFRNSARNVHWAKKSRLWLQEHDWRLILCSIPDLFGSVVISTLPIPYAHSKASSYIQGCINRSILPSGMGARGVSSEHVENMEMFSGSPLRCSPVLQLRCALVLGEPCSGSRRTVLWFWNRALASEGEKQAYICWCSNKDIHCMLVEGKSRSCS